MPESACEAKAYLAVHSKAAEASIDISAVPHPFN